MVLPQRPAARAFLFEVPAGSKVAKGVLPQTDTDAKLAALHARDAADELVRRAARCMTPCWRALPHADERNRNPDYQYAFTDGKNTVGRDFDGPSVAPMSNCLRTKGIPVFMVLWRGQRRRPKALVALTGISRV